MTCAATAHCQVYKPKNRYDDADRAVDETSGWIVTYKGRIVATHFFAHCDGHTRNSEEAWSGQVAYYRSVPCICGYDKLWGHGVGMCQRGAAAMANQGATAEQILTHYYTGIETAPATIVSRYSLTDSVVFGRVVDAQGQPHGGERLVLDGQAGRFTKGTTPDGRFWFTSLPAGRWELKVKARPVRYGELFTDGRSGVQLNVVVPDAPVPMPVLRAAAEPQQLTGRLGYDGVPLTVVDPAGNDADRAQRLGARARSRRFCPATGSARRLQPANAGPAIRRRGRGPGRGGRVRRRHRMILPVRTLDELRAARAQRYRQQPDLRVRTEAEALEFLNDVGLCLLFSAKDIELPTLWGALCGEDRPLPKGHDNHELGLAWNWKDKLPIEGRVLYGKFLRKKPVFVSLDLAPSLVRPVAQLGEIRPRTICSTIRTGGLSVEAKQVYETLLQQGALPTSRLRREAGLGGKRNAGRFDRALAELQMDWRIHKVAISNANRWGYCYVYDLLPKPFPGVVEAAREIGGRQARETILLRYLRTVVAATPRQVALLFGWTARDVDRLAERLAGEGRLHRNVRLDGLEGEYLVTAV